MGLRELTWVREQATLRGLTLSVRVAMPANNATLPLTRSS